MDGTHIRHLGITCHTSTMFILEELFVLLFIHICMYLADTYLQCFFLKNKLWMTLISVCFTFLEFLAMFNIFFSEYYLKWLKGDSISTVFSSTV